MNSPYIRSTDRNVRLFSKRYPKPCSCPSWSRLLSRSPEVSRSDRWNFIAGKRHMRATHFRYSMYSWMEPDSSLVRDSDSPNDSCIIRKMPRNSTSHSSSRRRIVTNFDQLGRTRSSIFVKNENSKILRDSIMELDGKSRILTIRRTWKNISMTPPRCFWRSNIYNKRILRKQRRTGFNLCSPNSRLNENQAVTGLIF